MRNIFTLLLLFVTVHYSIAQSVYPSTKYAKIGDTAYLTSAQLDTSFDFIKTGAAYTWNFSKLNGTSQVALAFRDPKNVGYTATQWPYIYNTANVNLSSADGQNTNITTVSVTDRNDYYLKSTGALLQKASSYNLSTGGQTINIKNTFSTVDSIYKFPLNYKDTFASKAGFTTTIPFLYYNKETLDRTNKVDGYGTVITPYGTFPNCLRIISNVHQHDSFAVTGYTIPVIDLTYRQIKWLDTSKGYPVLTVTQLFNAGAYANQSIVYYDIKRKFNPKALFVFTPQKPVPGDTVRFYNLSSTSINYLWNFGDGTSSTSTNPTHIYTSAGTYPVKLIAYNDTLTDTITINVVVSSKAASLFTYSPLNPKIGDTLVFRNFSTNATSYKWSFGDTGTSTLVNPRHIYRTIGTYTVTLIAYNTGGNDTFSLKIIVGTNLPIQLVAFKGKHVENGNLLSWNTANTSTAASFVLEKSIDGINFTSLKIIGNNSTNDYQFTDESTINFTSVYYRLKMIDKDLTVTYSPIIVVNKSMGNTTIEVYPNPAKRNEHINISLIAKQTEKANIIITNLEGKTISKKQINLVAGNNNFSLPTTDFAAGFYLVKCLNASNAIIANSKFVISK